MNKSTVVMLLMAGLLIGCSMSSIATAASQGQAVPKPVRGAVIEIPETEINLGTIGPDEDVVVGEIVYLNVGDKVLEVKEVSGACACFLGFSGDQVVDPGDRGVIQVRFDKSKIPAGKIKRSLNVLSNDSTNSKVKVIFAFNIERDPMEEELREIKSSLTQLQKEMRLVRRDLRKALKLLEAGAKAKTKKKRDTTVYDIQIGSSPILGPTDAAVTIVEFADFQCPYCIREYPKLKQVLAKYPNDVRLVFKHYPLNSHKKSPPIHAATKLAMQQGGSAAFWKMHDMIIAQPRKIAIADLRKYAKKLELNMKEFDEVMADPKKINNLIKDDLAQAKKVKVRATPTVLINGLKLSGRSIKNYQKRIDQILNQRSPNKK